jgi:ComEC/Rec2-related protein
MPAACLPAKQGKARLQKLNISMKISKRDFLIVIIFVGLIAFRYLISRPTYSEGDRIRITSVVYSDPLRFDNSQFLRLSGLKVYLPLFPEVNYGDRVVVDGVVKDGRLDKPKLIDQKEGVSTSRIRGRIITFYQSVLPEPMAGLIGGITLGAKGAMPADFYDLTKVTGVAHIVVASGTNVTFVVSFLIATLTLFISRRKAAPFVIVGVVLYLFVSGIDAPLVRASVMAGALLLGQESGRVSSAWRLFIFTALLMLAVKPDWIGDIGFILSFVSTGSLMLFEKKVRDRLICVPGIIREGFSTSLSAQIGVSPILFVTFGQFNIWSPFINALVLWTVPYIMILGAVGGILGPLMPILGKTILWLSYPLLWWFTVVVSAFS